MHGLFYYHAFNIASSLENKHSVVYQLLSSKYRNEIKIHLPLS